MVACSFRKKYVSGKWSCYDGNWKCTDPCSCKDYDNDKDGNETESIDEDSICDTDEGIDDGINLM